MQGSDRIQPHMWSGEKGSAPFTVFKMEFKNLVGSLHDNKMRVNDVAETKERRLMELDIRNAGMPQETVDDFKKWTGDCTRCSTHAPRDKRRTTSATLKDQDSRRGSKWSVTSIRGWVQTGLSHTPG